MADIDHEYGGQFHESGEVADVEDEDLYIDELEAMLQDFDFDEVILIDFEGEEDFYA